MSVSGLSPAQIERLAILIEECGEVQKAAGKILRHGYVSRSPFRNQGSNRADLESELGDVVAAISLMVKNGDITQIAIDQQASVKPAKMARYLHEQ